MPARDSIHYAVVSALIRDGWTVSHDPLYIRYGERRVLIDLAAVDGGDAIISLDRGATRIAIENKSFSGRSPIGQLEQAVGQYVVYDILLQEVDPGRDLYLAILHHVFERLFQEPLGALVRERLPLRLIVVNCPNREIVEWRPHPNLNF